MSLVLLSGDENHAGIEDNYHYEIFAAFFLCG
jgi:hypothetical protein